MDELEISLLEIVKTDRCLGRRFPEETHRTGIVLIDCRAFRRPIRHCAAYPLGSPSDHALQDLESSKVPLFVAGIG